MTKSEMQIRSELRRKLANLEDWVRMYKRDVCHVALDTSSYEVAHLACRLLGIRMNAALSSGRPLDRIDFAYAAVQQRTPSTFQCLPGHTDVFGEDMSEAM
jgi:hypothetical protein